MDQKKTVRPFSMKDKIGYTLGDLGCCFTEQYRAMYLSIFYTLILQVNPFHVGILLLVTKIWDAVNDPIIGAIVDSRKATKGGKFIPWIRAFSFPMAVLCILALSMWATSTTACVWLHVRHLRSVRGAVHLRQRALRHPVQRDDR